MRALASRTANHSGTLLQSLPWQNGLPMPTSMCSCSWHAVAQTMKDVQILNQWPHWVRRSGNHFWLLLTFHMTSAVRSSRHFKARLQTTVTTGNRISWTRGHRHVLSRVSIDFRFLFVPVIDVFPFTGLYVLICSFLYCFFSSICCFFSFILFPFLSFSFSSLI